MGKVVEFPKQNDSAFPLQYQKSGCYAQVIAKIAWDEEAFSGDPRKMIESVIQSAYKGGIVDGEYTVLYPDRLFCLYGLWTAYTDRWEPASYVCAADEREALRMFYDGDPALSDDDKYHFLQGDGKSNVVWDPWEGGSVTAAKGVVLDKRVFKIIGRVYGGGC